MEDEPQGSENIDLNSVPTTAFPVEGQIVANPAALNLEAAVRPQLARQNLQFSKIIWSKMALAKGNQISVLSFVAVSFSPQNTKEYISLAHFDRDSYKPVCSFISSRKAPILVASQNTPLLKWAYNLKSGFWYFNEVYEKERRLLQIRIGKASQGKLTSQQFGAQKYIDPSLSKLRVKSFEVINGNTYLESCSDDIKYSWTAANPDECVLALYKGIAGSGKNTLKKVRSLNLDYGSLFFVRGKGKLRIFFTRRHVVGVDGISLFVANSSLKVTHKIGIVGLPASVERGNAWFVAIPRLVTGKRLLVGLTAKRLGGQPLEDWDGFCLGLDDLKLSKVVSGGELGASFVAELVTGRCLALN